LEKENGQGKAGSDCFEIVTMRKKVCAQKDALTLLMVLSLFF
jgi:hypothetical protein